MDSFWDRYDSTVSFVEQQKEKLANKNLNNIKRITLVLFIIFFLYVVLLYIIDPDKMYGGIICLITPVILASCYALLRWIDRQKMIIPFWGVRFISFVAMSVYMVLLCAMESFIDPDLISGVAAVVIFGFAGIYTDYLLMVVFLEILLGAEAVIVKVALSGTSGMSLIILFVGAAVVAAVFVEWVILENLTQNALLETTLKDEGSRDLLTGLYNKIAFERRAGEYLRNRSDSEKGQGVLLIIDFDNFKQVNDKYGHGVGDEVLKLFGRILKKTFRANDLIGRVGGDEFMVLMRGEVPDAIIDMRCNNLEHELNIAHVKEAGSFSCSIGVAADNDRFMFDELYRFADEALYEAKERGKATFVKRRAEAGDIPPDLRE